MAENDQETPNAGPHEPAAPEGERSEEHAEILAEGEPHAAPPEAETAPESGPARRKRGFGQKFTLLVSALGLLATIGGGAAIVFKDKDARLRAVADALEGAARDPLGVLHEGENRLGAWLAAVLPRGESESGKPQLPADKAEAGKPGPLGGVASGARLAEEPAKPAPTPGWSTPREVEPPAKAEASPAEEPAKPATASGWAAPREIQPSPKAEAPPAVVATPSPMVRVEAPKIETAKSEAPKPSAPKPSAPAPSASTKSEPRAEAPIALEETEVGAASDAVKEIAALSRRLTAMEESLREARDAARAAQVSATAKSDGGAEKSASPELQDKLAALQGRVQDLSEAVEGLRAQLDQPKVDTRAAADVESARAGQKKALTALETLALAQSLREAFVRGEPYAEELSALQARGADAELLSTLAPFAEHGAPQSKDLLAMFQPIRKRLRAIERPADAAGSLTDQLLHDAQKLVRVRPVTQAAPNTAEELVPLIEQALAQDDLTAASAALAKLPELAKGDVKPFSDALNGRVAGDKAAAELVRQSVAALGRDKN